jgi:PTS system mannitol-specific IIC component
MSSYTPTVTGTGARATVQRFGAFLAGMVMPNLGAFIAFGIITTLFIPTGWLHLILGKQPITWVDQISSVVGPLIVILIPILIAYTGGKNVHGHRGGVVGAVALIGAMLAPVALKLAPIPLNGVKEAPPANISEIGPTILAAFVLGPLAALVMKAWDNFIAGKVKGGFEMLVDNFSAGVVGAVFAIIGLYIVGPITFWITQGLGWLANWLINAHLLPLVSIVVEPAKVLFLNNAINHGVFTPLGIEQASTAGRSIFFMIESNPGPGLGILTAMLLFGPRAIRPTVPAAMVVHFLGGIHEIYFPYVLAHPIMIVAMWAGGIAADFVFVVLHAGLVATPSPGSIFAYLAVIPKGGHVAVLSGVAVGIIASFLVGSMILKLFPVRETAEAGEPAQPDAELAPV